MTSIREISFHRTRNSILLERVSGVSIMCCCHAGVSSFSFSCLRGRGRRGVRGDSVALLSVVNSGNKGAAKRKLHRNKISSFPLPPPCYRCLVTYFSITLLTWIPYRIASHYESIFFPQRFPKASPYKTSSINVSTST